MDRHLWTNVDEWKGLGGQNRTNVDRHSTELQWTLDEIMTNVGQNGDGHWTKLRRTSNKMEWNGTDGDNAVKQSTFTNSITMACEKKKRIFFLSCLFIYSVLLIFLPELLQGLLITRLQAQKHTRVHSPDANLKTHVQGKQVCVGLHHLV
jgi:hypothetical protein